MKIYFLDITSVYKIKHYMNNTNEKAALDDNITQQKYHNDTHDMLL